jgi:DNA-binding transcriptional ArsR family regulator
MLFMVMKSDELDDIFIALADPTRRAILRQLSDGASRVTDLAHPFDISLNSVSKHLRMLERAHLISRRRHGREHFLELNGQQLERAHHWLETQRSLWSRRLAAMQAMFEEQDRRQSPDTSGKTS